MDTFEHIFAWKESLTKLTEGQGLILALPTWKDSFLKHCLASCCYFCVHLEGWFSQITKKKHSFFTYFLVYLGRDRYANSFFFLPAQALR